MKARKTNVITVYDAIDSNPYLAKKQKDELKAGLDKCNDQLAVEAARRLSATLSKNLNSVVLLILHNEFGFGKERLEKYVKAYDKTATGLFSFVEGTDIRYEEGAYHDLKHLYPDEVDRWVDR